MRATAMVDLASVTIDGAAVRLVADRPGDGGLCHREGAGLAWAWRPDGGVLSVENRRRDVVTLRFDDGEDAHDLAIEPASKYTWMARAPWAA